MEIGVHHHYNVARIDLRIGWVHVDTRLVVDGGRWRLLLRSLCNALVFRVHESSRMKSKVPEIMCKARGRSSQ
jgi:hypothetical protein